MGGRSSIPNGLTRSLLPQFRRQPTRPSEICFACQSRFASNAASNKKIKAAKEATKKRKERSTYKNYNLRDADQYSLVEAMRYIRAFEVGYPPSSPKYEVAIRLKSVKNSPVVRNRIRLPHPVKTDLRICVICPRDSPQASAALEAGASLVGEEEVFADIKSGKIDFDRCLCVEESQAKLNKAGLGRILGPKGLMPSAKAGTIVKNAAVGVRSMVGASEYRENRAVIRLPVANLAAAPQQVKENVVALVAQIKKDLTEVDDVFKKSLHEVVLSSTHAPGFTLSGDFQTSGSITAEEITP